MALRGRFLPSAKGTTAGGEQFCDRRLLLHIHRQMKQKFRRSIVPATPAQLWQLLARWQHAWPGTQLGGSTGLLRVLHKLQGFVAGAASYEEDLLPLRLRGYDAAWLDALCLSGEVAWGRLRPGSGEGRFSRSTPISLWRRGDADFLVPPRPPFGEWLAATRAAASQAPADAETGASGLSPLAEALGEVLARRGARFFAELCRDVGRPAKEVATALGELCAAGLCTSDGFSGLRLLLGQVQGTASSPFTGQAAMAAGRWALIEGPREEADSAMGPVAVSRARFRGALPVLGDEADWDNPALLESWTNQYLMRYGVLTRELFTREPIGPPLYVVLPVLRRLEARGLVRSGYFVAGLSGEQFATPEALSGLDMVRKQQRPSAPVQVRISAADPLNLAGILFAGPKAPSTGSALLLYQDGEPCGVSEAPAEAQSA
jgi:ATP-dependent Lhr-like helicase